MLGHLSYETDQNGTVLATFTYDSMGVPVSVQVGSDPNASPRYYYVYNGHGDVVALVDAQGNVAASYAYDAFGALTSFSENFGGTTTWTNPYRYDGQDGVRYDGEMGLYWMSMRAYDPALGRFQLQCHSSSCWIMLAVELRNARSARKQQYPPLQPKTLEICLLTQARIPEPAFLSSSFQNKRGCAREPAIEEERPVYSMKKGAKGAKT